MNSELIERLNQIEPRITNPDFLSSEGIGNEIACYIFDYPAEDELQVREHVGLLRKRLASHHRDLKVLHLNLLDVVVDYLKDRKLFDKTIEMQERKGDAAVLGALKGPLVAEKVRDYIASQHKPQDHDLILITGVGSAWPMLRAHSLLNCLHTATGQVPLVMFYPGEFDGTTLRLFGRISANSDNSTSKPYYRAFRLIPRENKP